MKSPLTGGRPRPLAYPEDDGLPMSENTLQFQWIVTIKENLEAMFADRDDVFVAGDLLWYPIEGHPEIRTAPDALVVFGRPKGYRGSYLQWAEAGVPPTVVFEILSPGNRAAEMTRKFQFYERYGVDEYYLYDPDHNELSGWRRVGATLEEIATMDGWTSPRLGVRFELADDTLRLLRPDGERFLTFVEMAQANEKAQEHIKQQADEIAQLRQRLKALGETVDE